MTLKEALEKNKISIDLNYKETTRKYICLLESIVLKQDEALQRVYKIDKGYASQGMSNGTYKIVVQTQSEVLKMLQPESEGE